MKDRMLSAGQATRSGISLIELLFVVAIICILVGLLTQGVHAMRQRAMATVCVSNLRQLGLALQMYTSHHDGRLPYPNANYGGANRFPELCWYNAIDPYLLGGPAATSRATERPHYVKQDPIIKRLSPAWFSSAHTIKMNEWLARDRDGNALYTFYGMDGFQDPSRTVLLFDGKAETNVDASGDPGTQARQTEGSEGDVMRRHRDGANVLFADGHVSFRIEKKQTGGNKWGWQVNQTSLVWKPFPTDPPPDLASK
jgi:prepilin-type processing-associated H-X9-DG protein